MSRGLLFRIVFILLLATGIWAYPAMVYHIKKLTPPHAEDLKHQIIRSIKNPFPQADTMVLKGWIGDCGHTPVYERPIFFDTELDSATGQTALSYHLNLPVADWLADIKMEANRRNKACHGKFDSSYVDQYQKKKVYADIWAEQLNSRKIMVHEYYDYNGLRKTIDKEFTYSGGKWKCQITYSL